MSNVIPIPTALAGAAASNEARRRRGYVEALAALISAAPGLRAALLDLEVSGAPETHQQAFRNLVFDLEAAASVARVALRDSGR